MRENDTSEPAEKIADEELLARTAALVNEAETPFVTTSQVDSVVEELKLDQVRNRLKSLAEEQDEVVYTNTRGLVFWISDDASDIGGEIEVDIRASEPDWEQISAEQLPPDLIEEVVSLHEEQNTPYPTLETFSEAFLRTGFYLFIFVFLLAFGEAFILDGTLSAGLQNIAAGLILGSVLCFGVHISLLVFIKISTWRESNRDIFDLLSR